MAKELIVDLHVHSHYSRATSKDCTIEGLYYWGKKKGINIIGTGDFTHPAWFAEFRDKLTQVDGGLFALRQDIAEKVAMMQSHPDYLKNYCPAKPE